MKENSLLITTLLFAGVILSIIIVQFITWGAFMLLGAEHSLTYGFWIWYFILLAAVVSYNKWGDKSEK